jgi:hypothetical protein
LALNSNGKGDTLCEMLESIQDPANDFFWWPGVDRERNQHHSQVCGWHLGPRSKIVWYTTKTLPTTLLVECQQN